MDENEQNVGLPDGAGAPMTEAGLPLAGVPRPTASRGLGAPCLAVRLATGLLGLCLCACVAAAVLAAGIAAGGMSVAVITEGPEVEAVLDRFMTAMAARDPDAAYAVVATDFGGGMTRADLDEMLAGNNSVLFDGYRELAVTGLTLNIFTPDSDYPDGRQALASGEISFDGGFTGEFEAELTQVGGAWRLAVIETSVPPAKFPASP
jgi:hypothetical protein